MMDAKKKSFLFCILVSDKMDAMFLDNTCGKGVMEVGHRIICKLVN